MQRHYNSRHASTTCPVNFVSNEAKLRLHKTGRYCCVDKSGNAKCNFVQEQMQARPSSYLFKSGNDLILTQEIVVITTATK